MKKRLLIVSLTMPDWHFSAFHANVLVCALGRDLGIYVYMYMYVYVHMYMYICVYMQTYELQEGMGV